MLRLSIVAALVAGACAACGFGDGEPEPLATRSPAPIAFLRAQWSDVDPTTGTEPPPRHLVIVDPDGGNERTVNTPGFDVESFSWSPDGRQLVFAARPLGDYRRTLFLARADGTGVRALRKTPDHSPNPVWSPRGDMIAWDNHADGLHEVWVMNADGSDARRLAPATYGGNPLWSPDGAKIAWGNNGWKIMNSDGSGKTDVPDLAFGHWTPAGIAYRTSRGIGLLDPETASRRVALEVGQEWQRYQFSLDGGAVALSGVAGTGGDWEIGFAAIDDGEVKMLTRNGREDLAPSLSADARSLVFEAVEPTDQGEAVAPPGDIYVVNADGSGERNLTDSPEDESAPAWAPGSSLTPI